MTARTASVLLAGLVSVLAVSIIAGPVYGSSSPGELTCLAADHETQLHCKATAHQVETHRHETSGKHVLEIGIARVNCNTVTSHITTFDGSTATPEAQPTYGGCSDSISGNAVHVETNDCEYEFHIGNTSGETKEEDEYEAWATLRCVTVLIFRITNSSEATKCTIEIGEQSGIAPIYFRSHTGASPTDVTIEFDTALISATFTGGFFNCGVTNGVHNIKYTGNTTARAFNTEDALIDSHVD